MIKGSFPISKVVVFGGNSFVRGKNEVIRLFHDYQWKLFLFQKMTILDYFMIAHGKECE